MQSVPVFLSVYFDLFPCHKPLQFLPVLNIHSLEQMRFSLVVRSVLLAYSAGFVWILFFYISVSALQINIYLV